MFRRSHTGSRHRHHVAAVLKPRRPRGLEVEDSLLPGHARNIEFPERDAAGPEVRDRCLDVRSMSLAAIVAQTSVRSGMPIRLVALLRHFSAA